MSIAADAERTHRKPPLAVAGADAAPGLCLWCGEPTNSGRRWHSACGEECEQLGDTVVQRALVIQRDGMICAMCGRPGLVLELEHRVPLWAVAGLPLAARRAFYTVANLQMVHPECHLVKTAGEAAARAEMMRRAEAPLRTPVTEGPRSKPETQPARSARQRKPAQPARLARSSPDDLYRFFGSPRDERYGQQCKIAVRGPSGSIVLLFADGHRQAAHRINVRSEKRP